MLEHRRHRVANGQCSELPASTDQEWIGTDHEPARLQLYQVREHRIEVTLAARVQNVELQAEVVRRCLQVTCTGLGKSGIGRIDEQRLMTVAVGSSSCSSSSRFGATSTFNWVTPVMLPPGRLRLATSPSLIGSPPVSKTIGITAVAALAASAAGGADSGDDAHLSPHEIGRPLRQPLVSVLCPPVFDLDVAALDVTAFAQPLPEGSQHRRLRFGGDAAHIADHWHRLLRACGARPADCSAAERGYQLSSSDNDRHVPLPRKGRLRKT
jgi:hypothetical protein